MFLYEDNKELIDVQQCKFSKQVYRTQSLPFRTAFYDTEKRPQNEFIHYMQRINIFTDSKIKRTKTKDDQFIKKK